MAIGSCFSRCRAVLLFCGVVAPGLPAVATAHSPHDHIEAFEIGPALDHPDGSRYVMLIVVRGNLWRSVDAGASWKRIVRGLDNREALARIAVEGKNWLLSTEGGVVFRSRDDGWSWQRAPEEMKLPVEREISGVSGGAEEDRIDQRVTSVLKLDGARIFEVRWSEGVFLSTDGGETWGRRAKGLTTDSQGDRRGLPQFTTLREAPDGSGALFLAGYDGLFRSDNDGESWEQIETLPETLLIDFAISPAHRQDGELVATTYWKGAFHSSDGGTTWQPINGNIAPSKWEHLKRKLKGDDEYAQIARFHSITFSPGYANDRTLFAGLRNWFLISANRGDHWRRIELTQFANGEDVIPDRIVFSDKFAEDGTLFFCGRLGEGKTRRGGIFKSVDRGLSFELVHEAECKYMQSLAISPAFSDDGTILASSARGGNNSEVFRSRDAGETWQVVTGDLEFVDFGAELAFAFKETVWAGTERGLWLSLDAGDHWSRESSSGFQEEGFVDMVATYPLRSLVGETSALPIVFTVKGKGTGIFTSESGYQKFRPEFFEKNHQFNRLWSYSPGAMVKFVPPGDPPEWRGDFFAMTGESMFRITRDSIEELPIRATAALQGEVNLTVLWLGVATAIGVAVVAGLVWFRRRKSA